MFNNKIISDDVILLAGSLSLSLSVTHTHTHRVIQRKIQSRALVSSDCYFSTHIHVHCSQVPQQRENVDIIMYTNLTGGQ